MMRTWKRLLPVTAVALLLMGFAAFVGPGSARADGGPTVAVQQQCNGNTVQLTLTWNSYNVGPQWVDVSPYNYFTTGVFSSNGPYAAGTNSVVIGGLPPGNVV